jgi:ribonucleoside-diphosphate reductase alpha chain
LDQQFRISTVEISQPGPAVKPAPVVRDRLPSRRHAITSTFERDGSRFEMTVGYYPDGYAGEIFLNADRANSLLDSLVHDAAILTSLALQYGAPIDEIRHALKRDAQDEASEAAP